MVKNLKKKGVFVLAAAAFMVLLVSALPAMAAVTVYAEGAYTDTDLVVYIYADIDTNAICSAGIKLTYDKTVLTVATAVKNEAVWYMGDGSTNHPYMNPEDTGDDVIVICGKLDTSAPTDGVLGDRVLLGIVSFNRNDGGAAPGADPEGYFGISVELGRVDPFANFVTTGGTKLDGTADLTLAGAIVRERGDANADGVINVNDLRALRRIMGPDDLPCYVDCNGDGVVNVNDLRCLRRAI